MEQTRLIAAVSATSTKAINGMLPIFLRKGVGKFHQLCAAIEHVRLGFMSVCLSPFAGMFQISIGIQLLPTLSVGAQFAPVLWVSIPPLVGFVTLLLAAVLLYLQSLGVGGAIGFVLGIATNLAHAHDLAVLARMRVIAIKGQNLFARGATSLPLRFKAIVFVYFWLGTIRACTVKAHCLLAGGASRGAELGRGIMGLHKKLTFLVSKPRTPASVAGLLLLVDYTSNCTTECTVRKAMVSP